MSTEVPKTWGEADTALLPYELRRPLQKLNLFFTVEHRTKTKTKIIHTNYSSLVSDFSWRPFLSSEELLQIINRLAPYLLGNSFEHWLDFPTLPKFQMGETIDVSHLALLRRSHLLLKEREIPLHSLNVNLQYGTFLTLLNLTDDLVTALDLVVTARNHHASVASDWQPETLDELFTYLTQCILIEHGLERQSNGLENLQKIVGPRLGFHKDGPQTLQAISDSVGVTRERIRQIVQQALNKDAGLDRVWPTPPILKSLVTQISLRKTWDDEHLNTLLFTEFNTRWNNPCQTIIRVLEKYESKPSLALLKETDLVSINDVRVEFNFPTRQEIRKSILHSGGMSCFALIDDVIDNLAPRFPEIPRDDLRQAIRENAIYGDLPFDYVFASGHQDQIAPISRALLMLAWAGELSVDEIRIGLDRYGRFRRMPPAPPIEVLQAFYQLRPEFSVDGRSVRATIPTNRGEDSIEGQIALLCEQQDGAVISKTLVQDHFRRLGRYTSSASVNMTFSPILRPAGVGCITIVGHNPTAEEIDAARKLGSNLTIDSDVIWNSAQANPRIDVFVGTAFRDSGVISIPSQKARWLEGRRFRVLGEDSDEHGSLSVSGNFFYGFSSFFNAMQIDTGDTIQIELDTKNEVAHIRVNVTNSEF